MKHFFLSIFVVLNQIAFTQKIIGSKVGLSLPYQYNKTTASSGNFERTNDMIVSFHAGLIVNLKVSEHASFQPSLQVSGKGSKFSYMAGVNMDIPAEQKFHLNYVELALPVLYNISINKNFLFIGGGPALAYGISGKEESSFTSTTSDPFKTFLKRFDAAIILQSGIRIKSLQASVEYNYGLYNFLRNEEPYVQNGAKGIWKNRSVGLSVAYFWNLKK
jgi:hypothetical protein